MTRLLLTVPRQPMHWPSPAASSMKPLASGAIASIRIDGSRRIPLTALKAYVSRLLQKGPPRNA